MIHKFIQSIHQRAFTLTLAVLLSSFYACDPERVAENRSSQDFAKIEIDPNEEYIMVTTIINFPMYVNRDQAAFKRWGARMGVKTSILGPSEWDVPGQIAVIEQLIGLRPAGILINGTDPALKQVIDKAVDSGIPTVVYDSDIPGSKRHGFLGTDWYEIGRLQGEAMVKLIGGKGKIAYMGILGMTNMESGFKGLTDVLQKYPEIEIVGKFDDKANTEEAAKITADLLSAHPDLAGICGFDAMSGPGIGMAVKEANKAGRVIITTVDWEPEHLKLVKEGVIQHLVGQKRELFTWYGAQFLYDMVHRINSLSADYEKAGIVGIPYSVNTGLIEINESNIDLILAEKKSNTL